MRQNKNAIDAKLPAARPMKIATLVDYQSGSIVSREVLRSPTGKVVLFAFDEGEGLSEHTSPFDALVQVIEGEAEITVSGASNKVSEGELILMPAHQPHALKASKRFKMVLTLIRP